MSLQERIVQQKSRLQPCDTIVTLPTGQIIKEKLAASGNSSQVIVGSSYGFIVDDKPDLQVAKILPGLCMGSQDVVLSPDLLVAHNITHVLSVGVIEELPIPGIQHLHVPLLDLPETDLSDALGQCIPFIDNAREAKGCVFVHCNAGVSRSATVVIAYLMKDGLSFKDAYEFVKLNRHVIRPNEGFIRYLKELEIRRKIDVK